MKMSETVKLAELERRSTTFPEQLLKSSALALAACLAAQPHRGGRRKSRVAQSHHREESVS